MKPHARLDVKAAFNRKVVWLGNGAFGALVRLVAWSNDHGSNGVVDDGLLGIVAASEERARLLAKPPWAEGSPALEPLGESGTYRIHDFLDWNDSAEIVAERREAKARAGKARWKQIGEQREVARSAAAHAGAQADAKRMVEQRGDGDGDGDGADPEGVQGGDPPASPTPAGDAQSGVRALGGPRPVTAVRAPGGVSAWDLAVRELYIAGIRRGTGAGYVWPDGYGDQGQLNQAIAEFAKFTGSDDRLTGDRLKKWVELAAFDFASSAVASGDIRFGLGPKAFAKWLTADEAKARQKREARACP